MAATASALHLDSVIDLETIASFFEHYDTKLGSRKTQYQATDFLSYLSLA